MENNSPITINNSFNILKNYTNNTLDLFNNTDLISPTEGNLNFLSAKTLIVILILLVHTIASPIFEKFQFHYIHESGISMLLGMIVGLVSMVVSPNVNYLFNMSNIFD
jgi:uncharacterized membrane protein